MDALKTKEKRKRKRRTSDRDENQWDVEPVAKKQKFSFDPPAELLVEIFKHFDPTDLIIMGRVCKYWNECVSSHYNWRLFSSYSLTPTGVSWDIEKYLQESDDGFLKADIKYITPDSASIRRIHSFELYYRGEYLARQEVTRSFRNPFRGDQRVFEEYVDADPEYNHDTDLWTIEARIIPQPNSNQPEPYKILFSIYFNVKLAVLTAIRKGRKFPKKELIFKNLDSDLQQMRDIDIHQYWNVTTHPHAPTLVDPAIFGDAVKLFDHQYKALNWMLYIEQLPEVSYSQLMSWSKSPNIFLDLWREELVPIEDIKKHEITFKPKGGILADDIGLGKTLTAVSLIFADKKFNGIETDLPSKIEARYSSKATLVICPAALIGQWQEEIARFKELSVLVMTEPNQILEVASDIILLTDVLLKEFSRIGSVLFNVNFRRIILEESHDILLENKYVLNQLRKEYAWCITVSLNQNELVRSRWRAQIFPADLRKEFLEIPLPANFEAFGNELRIPRESLTSATNIDWTPINLKRYISDTDKLATIRYNLTWMMCSKLMWCTKRGYSPEVNFPSSTPEIVRIDLTPFEQLVLDSTKDPLKKVAIVAGVDCFHKTVDDLKADEMSYAEKGIKHAASSEEDKRMREYLKKLESVPFLAADPEASEKNQMINLFGSKLAEIVLWVRENVVKENKKCIIFSKKPTLLGYISFVFEQSKINTMLFTKYLNDISLTADACKNNESGILLLELDRKILSGLHFNKVNYIILLDLLSEPAAAEDENFKTALAAVTSIGNGPSHEVKRVRFIVNNSLDEELYNCPEKVTTQTTWLVNRALEEFHLIRAARIEEDVLYEFQLTELQYVF